MKRVGWEVRQVEIGIRVEPGTDGGDKGGDYEGRGAGENINISVETKWRTDRPT